MEEAVEQCQEEMSCDLLNTMILDLASQITCEKANDKGMNKEM